MDNNTKIEGKIIKLSPQGWGFITSPEIKFTRIFFHWSALTQSTLKFPDLKMHMKVRFVAVEHKDYGWRAYRVEVIEPNDRT